MKNPSRPVSWIIAALVAFPAGGATGAAFVFSGAVMAAAAAPPAPSDEAARVAGQIAKAKAALPPCLQPQGDPIPAQKIMQDLAAGRTVDLQGRVIDGSLDADVAGVASDEHRTSLRILPGRLRLDACRVSGRVMMPRTIMQELVITCSEVGGDIELSDSIVQGNLLLDRTKVVGDVRLARALVDRDVSMKGATVEGSIEVSGGRVGSVVLSGAEIHRDIEVSREVVQGLDMNTAQVNGSVKLEDVLVVNSLSAHQARIGRSLAMDTVRTGSGVDFNELMPVGGVSASNLTVDGGLMMSLSGTFSVVLQDTVVGQNLVMVDGDFGDVAFEGLKVRMGTEMEGSRFRKKVVAGNVDFGNVFSASQARFEGQTEFRNVRFAGQDPMAGAMFASAPVLVDTVLPVPPTLMGDENAASADDEGDEGDEGGGDAPQ